MIYSRLCVGTFVHHLCSSAVAVLCAHFDSFAPFAVPDFWVFQATVRRIVELEVQLANKRYVDPAFLASLYAQLGEKDQAFAWLDKAYNENSDLIAYIKTIPDFDNMRADPRYASLIKKMGLPE